MMGLSQIIEANEDPEAFRKSRLSDGQKRREERNGKAYWSESTANGDDAILVNPVPGSEWADVPPSKQYKPSHGGYPTVEDQIKSPVGSFKQTQAERNLLNEDATTADRHYYDFDVVRGEVVPVPSKDKIMAALSLPDKFKVEPLPPIYFDAVQLHNALEQTVAQGLGISHALGTAIHMVQGATDETKLRAAVAELNRIVSNVMHRNPAVDLNLLITLLENEVVKLSPPFGGNPYRPRHGLDHAMHPIKGIIGKMRLAISKIATETDS